MFYDKLSRRMFLQGVGKTTLAIPFLPSLLSREAQAFGSSPVRYIQFMTNSGGFDEAFYPPVTNVTQLAPGVKGQSLASISGPMSPVWGSAFDGFRKKISLIHGLDCMTASNGIHNNCLPTTGSLQANQFASPVFPYSLDTVLANSVKVYPSLSGVVPLANLSVNTLTFYQNWSFDSKNGNWFYSDLTTDTNALLAKFTWSTGNAAPPDPLATLKPKVLNDVQADFQALTRNPALASECKVRLQNYMDLISQLSNSLGSPNTGPVCTQPVLNQSDDINNRINIIVAALACNITKVVSIGCLSGYGGDDPMHHAQHQLDVPTHTAIMNTQVTPYVAFFLKQLDAIQEPDGTLLDNSIFYHGNEWGTGGGHVTTGMPVLMAGSAGGRLKNGYLLEYANSQYFYNNLFVTILNSMGLSSSDYERNGQTGFGAYDINPGMPASQRRTPLGFYYQGPNMG